ncbi:MULTISPECIES: PAS domain-containing protein [unclassified Tatumella]|uniref:helix-turn-helix transcriptional regulator n=1 Tax=unclassified Tatumella TaxID=2649542 RepID=UPI001BAE86EA|nr:MULTISPECIES: PAS domain-containing protein [unclassified Tatumella]MBS0878170.1 PAS domain-containing protein [Tatumella sp. JGM82]MBS0892285.1 PAS domain-containing protein [Tatumella sp. JGM94]MBS0902883.1 PAS domain-containing protein [Tatumella sp. JGM100]
MQINHGTDELSDFKVNFNERDREFMRSYYRLAEMVADLVGPHSEVVLHSFEDLDVSVVKIVNGHHTGRTIGSPITDMGLKMLRQFLQTGEVNSRSYFTRNKQGQLLKSTTCVVAGENEKPIGLFCVNINLSVPFPELIRTLMPDSSPLSLVNEHFSANSSEVIDEATKRVMFEVESDTSISQKYRNKAIVFQLFENGIFELKESAGMVAEKIGISRHAIYKYLREFKSALNEKE